MENILTSKQITEWYQKLNFARTQSGIGLASLPEP